MTAEPNMTATVPNKTATVANVQTINVTMLQLYK